MPQYIQIEEIRRQPPDMSRFALWDLGMRPFYLLASLWAALGIPLWAMQFAGWIGGAGPSAAVVHAHEMIFGFVLAVITGFLFTAARNWSGQPTPTGIPLLVLAALWVAARIAAFTPWLWTSMVLNLLFVLGVMLGLWQALRRGENRRNDFFLILLAALAAASVAIHLSRLGYWPLPGPRAVQIALDLVLFIVAVMAGRVVPMFTNNAIRGAGASRHAWLDRVSLAAILAVLACDLAAPDGAGGMGLQTSVQALVQAAVFALACAAHLGRWPLWRPWRTPGHPLVSVLHLAYLWIVVHLALRLTALAGLTPASLAIHALTVGAVGGMIIGMMIRTARGHTGLPLLADRADRLAIALVQLAAVIRVFVPALAPPATVDAILVGGLAWSLGFAVYAVRYAPVLSRPRRDGRPD